MRSLLAIALGVSACFSRRSPAPRAPGASPPVTAVRAPLASPASLRFSPRPNRAREIPWREFGDAVFAEARARHVPVVFSLAAVWCHWCHVLDETTLSDPRVIARLTDHAVPVRVDADQRPDLERRYLLGGWPTVAFLDADGRVITGGTYIPPDRMVPLFDRVAAAVSNDPAALAVLTAEEPNESDEARAGSLPDDLAVRVTSDLVAHQDPVNGGTPGAPKFPDGLAVTLMLAHAREVPGARDAAARAITGIARLEDGVEGGFFRYATAADWTAPHFEKMTSSNAELIEALALASDEVPPAGPAADRAIAWVLGTMRDSSEGWFAASQDADEHYYALATVPARRAQTQPYVDRTPIAWLDARMARALLVAGDARGNATAREAGLTALRWVRDHMQREDGAMYHARVAGEPTLAGDLLDLAWSVRAFAYAARGPAEREASLGAAARAIAFAERSLASPSGGFYDRPALGEGSARLPGLLASRFRVFELNMVFATALAEYGRIAGDGARVRLARRTLESFGAAWHGRSAHEAWMGIAFDALQAAETPPNGDRADVSAPR